MKLKHLESILSQIPQHSFPSPNIILEQYPTSIHLASSVILTAFHNGDVGPGKSALDLGCGTGILTLGCVVVGCEIVWAVDCDEGVMDIARENMREMMMKEEEDAEGRVEFVLGKVQNHCLPASVSNSGRGSGGGGRGRNSKRGRSGRGRGRGGRNNTQTSKTTTIPPPPPSQTEKDGIPLQSKIVDTVLTNPPFGTKANNIGIDIQFLRTALRLARTAVYSFHKSSTRGYIIKTIQKWNEMGNGDKRKEEMKVEVVAEMKFDIGKIYKFHKEKSVDVEVDLIRVSFVSNDDEEEEDGQTEIQKEVEYDSREIE